MTLVPVPTEPFPGGVGITSFRLEWPTPYVWLMLYDAPSPAAVVDLATGTRCEFDPEHEAATLPITEDTYEMRIRFELGDTSCEATLRWPQA
jgi:hypothetical protein